MPLFEALHQLLNLALDELPEVEEGQQFTLEPITDWGVTIHTGNRIIEMVEFCGDVIVPCGGTHYAEGYSFIDCQCQSCQVLNAIHEKRLATMQETGA